MSKKAKPMTRIYFCFCQFSSRRRKDWKESGRNNAIKIKTKIEIKRKIKTSFCFHI